MNNLNYYSATKKLLLCTIIAVLTICCSQNVGFSMGGKKHPKSPNLYFYTRKDISRYLKRIGYSDFANNVTLPYDITRNSEGTALRFFDWINRKSIVAKCNGSIIELNIKGDSAWFNDQNLEVAWLKNRTIYYINGETDSLPFRRTGSDPGGNYFVRGKDPVKIFSIEHPKKPLASVKLPGSGVLRIFSKDDKVYVFDYPSDLKSQKRYPIKGYIFQRVGLSLNMLNEIDIPFPSTKSVRTYVEDLSPRSDSISLCDRFDWPRRSRWYEYNLETSEIKYIGKATAWGFYLRCNIIDAVEEKNK